MDSQPHPDNDLIGYMLQHKDVIVKNLNVSAIIPYLVKEGIIDLCQDTNDSKEHLVTQILEKGPKTCAKFDQCLNHENTHLGHKYIVSLLHNRPYADEWKINASARIKDRIMKNMSTVTRGMKLEAALIKHMYKKYLLTDDEFDMLISSKSEPQKMNLKVLLLLDTKGPTAHLIFAQCLKAESTHVTHQEIFELIYGAEERLEAQGELAMISYLHVIKKIRQCHNEGEWEAADTLIGESEDKSAELHVAMLLEGCHGLIIRKKTNSVSQIIAKAKGMCSTIDDNCKALLSSRCECTLAMVHLYHQEIDKALECIREAQYLQYNIQAGEDTALTNYCYGCILLECLSKQHNTEQEREAKMSLELAIDHAYSEDFGIDPAQAQIRLAQLYLGSSLCSSGCRNDHESLRSAPQWLDKVKVEAREPRTQCMYYCTEADMYKLNGDWETARTRVCKALGIAAAKGFATEIESAKARLQCLLINAPETGKRPPSISLPISAHQQLK